ncbi:MAG: tetratricopeptide repeat protein [Desulfobacteraceae bacterium]
MNHSLLKRVTLFIALFVFVYFSFYQMTMKRGSESHQSIPDSPVDEVDEKVVNLDSELKKTNILIKMGFETADIYYNRGWIYAGMGNYDLAKKDYAYAIELDNSHDDAYFNRGLIYLKEKKYVEAISDFSETIKLNPEMSDAYCNRGNAYLKTGKSLKALEDYNTAIGIDGEDPYLYYNRGLIYQVMGKIKKAKVDFKKAEELSHGSEK